MDPRYCTGKQSGGHGIRQIDWMGQIRRLLWITPRYTEPGLRADTHQCTHKSKERGTHIRSDWDRLQDPLARARLKVRQVELGHRPTSIHKTGAGGRPCPAEPQHLPQCSRTGIGGGPGRGYLELPILGHSINWSAGELRDRMGWPRLQHLSAITGTEDNPHWARLQHPPVHMRTGKMVGKCYARLQYPLAQMKAELGGSLIWVRLQFLLTKWKNHKWGQTKQGDFGETHARLQYLRAHETPNTGGQLSQATTPVDRCRPASFHESRSCEVGLATQLHPLDMCIDWHRSRPSLTLHQLVHLRTRSENFPGEGSWGLPNNYSAVVNP